MTRTTAKKKKNPIRILFICVAIALPTIHFLLTYVYVNFSSILMGFYQTIDGVRVWGFENFATFFGEFSKASSEIVLSFKNTFITFGIQVLMYPLGIVVSYFLYKKIFLHQFFRLVFFFPMIISSVVVVAVYRNLVSVGMSFDGEIFAGPISRLVQALWGLEEPVNLLSSDRFANLGVWIYLVWMGFPGNLILWGGTFSRIPDSLLEYGKLEGIGWGGELFRIILPLVWPTVSMTLILLFAGIFSASGNVFLLTEGLYGTQTFSNWMYMQVYQLTSPTSNALNYMSAVGLMVTIAACIIALVVRKISNQFEEVEY